MAKQGLNTSLIGKRICPKEEWGDPAKKSQKIPGSSESLGPNERIWADLKPSMDGKYTAEIDAAWTEEGSVKLAVHDPWGNTAEVWLKLVSIFNGGQ